MNAPAAPQFDFQVQAAPQRFRTLTQDRLERVYANFTARQRDFLDALPMLFHVNHPKLPGFVDKNTPFGISSYAPSEVATRAVRRLFQVADMQFRLARNYAVRGLYIMGSPGTIAYSRRSDLDMWVIHDPELDPAGLASLNKKATEIEKFATTLGLEVHFFVFDAERFRSGEDLSLSEESSGSSQHYLLLDEFYRSSLLVAGLPPLWWHVPVQYDGQYEAYVAAAEARGVLDRWNTIDFGGLPTIPADEFFGAAVWHLYKSIHAPYKSVLKLLLIEAYAAEHPDIVPLCANLKRNLEEGSSDLDASDPYILMYRKVETYLQSRGDPVRLEVLRRSFYLKTNVEVSNRAHFRDDWRTAVVKSLTDEWGWGRTDVERLDQRDQWGLDVAIDERRDLSKTFKSAYAMLSGFAKHHASDSKISKQDLQVLGRKLYVAFEKKPSKIEVITHGICANPVEQRLSLHETKIDGGKLAWSLFIGTVTPSETGTRQPIKRSGSAAEIVLWCNLNKLADHTTTWHVFTLSSKLTAADIKRINETIDHTLLRDPQSRNRNRDGDNDKRRIARVALLANVGVDPFSSAIGSGDVLTTNAGDPLAYGGRGMNLIQTVDLLFVTSWDETFAFRYEGQRAILEAVAECLQWMSSERAGHDLTNIETRCFSVNCATQIERRIKSLFTETLDFMTSGSASRTPGFILQSDEQLHHLRFRQGQVELESYSGLAPLMRALGGCENDAAQAIRFDKSCLRAGFLPHIYAHNKTDKIQIFAHQRGPRADVYILDERGALLVHRQECYRMSSLLQHYRRFLETALPRCQNAAEFPDTQAIVETFEIIATEDELTLKPYPAGSDSAGNYLSLHVLADADSNGHQQFSIYTSEREFSTWEHGGSLFNQVAAYVMAQRRSGDVYPIYITDLDLSTRFRQLVGVKALRPFDLLSYKKRIEFQLTRALHDANDDDPAVFKIAS